MKKVFLGGCMKPDWRKTMISKLKIRSFDPLIEGYNTAVKERGAEELIKKEKAKSDFELYAFTSAVIFNGGGYLSAGETLECFLKRPGKLVVLLISTKTKPLHENVSFFNFVNQCLPGATIFTDIDECIAHFNQYYVDPAFNLNMFQCLIERDGPTELNIPGGGSYLFDLNELGDYVCEVNSAADRKRLLHPMLKGMYTIYQPEKAPTMRFTPAEESFIREWEHMPTQQMIAYVNMNIFRFIDSRDRVRKKLIEKWTRQIPPGPGGQQCPVVLDPKSTQAQEDVSLEPEELEIWSRCLSMQKDEFRVYAGNNVWLNCTDHLEDLGRGLWTKHFGAESWPHDIEE